jgi:predicted dehydrogenase
VKLERSFGSVNQLDLCSMVLQFTVVNASGEIDFSKPFRLGVLGLSEGRSILSAALKSPDWEVAQICDLDETLCRERCAEFGLGNYTLDYAQMLADPTVDVVGIYTPDHLHSLHIQQALNAGKHVICTKPVLRSLTQAAAIREAWHRSECALLVGMSTRFFETFSRQREDVLAGKHGRVLSVEAHYSSDKRGRLAQRKGRWEAPDWLFTGLVHVVDLALWHLGTIDRVTAFGVYSENARTENHAGPDMLHALLTSHDGAVANISGCYGSPEPDWSVRDFIECVVQGDRGSSLAKFTQLTYHTRFDGEPPQVHDFRHMHDYYWRFEPYCYHAGEFQNYLDHFAVSLRSEQIPQPDFDVGIRGIAVLEAIRLAIAESRTVLVGDVLRSHGLGDMAT